MSNAAATLAPVFFMVFLGLVSRKKKWISEEQKDGANALVFNLLFPLMIFNVLFCAQLTPDHIGVVLWVFAVFSLLMLAGFILVHFFPDHFSPLSPYLLTTTEGGNVALPLYTSIVGMEYASNTVVFDIAGSLICFVVIPVILSFRSAEKTDLSAQIRKIFSNSFVIAVLAGVLLNVAGFRSLLESSTIWPVYTAIMNAVTAPVAPVILFVIGYNLSLRKDMIAPLLRLLSVRIVLFAAIIVSFFFLFTEKMGDPNYLLAVLIYFTCPTGFGIPIMIDPIMKSAEDREFSSAFLSVHMILTLIVYTILVLTVA